MFKQKLQEHCQKKKWGLPKYSTIKDGFDHIPRFRSSVYVDGLTFRSFSNCKSSKESQNDAAKIAFVHFTCSSTDPDFSNLSGSDIQKNEAENEFVLLSISEDHFDEVTPIFYKNMLQEMAQEECLSSPLYSTIRTGASHNPKFYSFVEMEGEKFYGKAGKSKKLAEASAAKVAYTHFNAMTRRAEFLPPILETDETDSSDIAVQNVENSYELLSSAPVNDDE